VILETGEIKLFFLTEFYFKVIDFNSSPAKEVFKEHLSQYIKK